MEGRHPEQGGPQGQELGSEQLQRWCRQGGRPGVRDTREPPGRRAGPGEEPARVARPQEEWEGAGGPGHLGHPSAGPVHRLGRFSVGSLRTEPRIQTWPPVRPPLLAAPGAGAGAKWSGHSPWLLESGLQLLEGCLPLLHLLRLLLPLLLLRLDLLLEAKALLGCVLETGTRRWFPSHEGANPSSSLCSLQSPWDPRVLPGRLGSDLSAPGAFPAHDPWHGRQSVGP